MKHALFADATDLGVWAGRRDAQGDLPLVVRQLVHATLDRPSRIEFAAGEGVQGEGWDGIVETQVGNVFVPAGTSGWEMGVDKKVKGKADADYEKRTKDPRGLDPAKSTFIFVTPRRWAAKTTWATKRKGESTWADVRAYDAEDLEAWLQLAQSVHVWLSIRLGKLPEGVTDFETFWTDWSRGTRPPITQELLLSGRSSFVGRVHSWLRNESDPLSIQGGSRDEALATFAAALNALPEAERWHYLARALVVSDSHASNRVAGSAQPLLLALSLDSPDAVSRARHRGHRVVIPLGRADNGSRGTVEIPRLSTDEAEKAIIAMGKPQREAAELASLARRGFMSFRRRLALSPELQQPPWARPEEALALCPALLAGTWDDTSPKDREAVAALAGTTYEAVTSCLVRWWNEADAPLRQVADKWIITSKEDAWSLLSRYLTRDVLGRFETVALAVLGEPDPRFDKPKGERWFSGVSEREPRHSELLRNGLADTLAVMASRETPTGSATTPVDSARVVVRCLLERANSDWRVWASLASLLPLLAEAAPEAFLQAAENGLDSTSPVLATLLAEEEEGMFGVSPHVGLLWALETLAWSPEHLCRASLLLAKLARLDPGGRLLNRPPNSLRSIFLPWHPQTAATPSQRLEVLDTLRMREPEVAWRLLKALLPEDHSVGHPTPRPRWREWAPAPRDTYVPAEVRQFAREVVARMVGDAGDSGERWSDLVSAIAELPKAEHELVVERLSTIDLDRMTPTSRATVWNELRRMVSKHRSFPDAEWALPADRVEILGVLLARFEPREPGPRFGWMFGHHPEFPDGREEDYQAREEVIKTERSNAVRAVLSEFGSEGLIQLAAHSEIPALVGETVGREGLLEAEESEILANYLEVSDSATAKFALGFGAGRVRAKGREWIEATLKGEIGRAWPAFKQAALLACLPPDRCTFDLVDTMGPEIAHGYWSRFPAYWIWEPGDAEHAARKLIEHGRPVAAVALLGHHAERKNGLTPTLIADALEAALHSGESWTPGSHEIGALIDLLETAGIEESRVAQLEWAYLHFIEHNRKPRVLHRELGRNPQFFADVVACAYRAEDEEPSEPSEADSARSGRAHRLLGSWRSIPGRREDGAIDTQALKEWMQAAREVLREKKQLAIGDYMIGETLSSSPPGDDGSWPHTAVRDEIEAAESSDLERGIQIGVSNSRGAMFRNPKGGGEPERGLAEKYAGFAAVARNRWPRTAAMLDRMAEAYRWEARREDRQSELREDLGL